jgi:hypothetical protein
MLPVNKSLGKVSGLVFVKDTMLLAPDAFILPLVLATEAIDVAKPKVTAPTVSVPDVRVNEFVIFTSLFIAKY